jgi:DNA-3-methyladenine glycosylase II
MHLIRQADDLERGADWLRRQDPRLAPALAAPLPLRLRPAGLEGLLWIVVGQQVSTASAAAIWARVQAAGLTTAPAIAAASEADLRGAGLSGPKLRSFQRLAATESVLHALSNLPDDQARARLLALPGVGPWTADIYLMFCLGRPDVFAAGDLALQEAARHLLALPARPDAAALARLAEPWSPWRSVAARALWSYYRIMKGQGRPGLGDLP